MERDPFSAYHIKSLSEGEYQGHFPLTEDTLKGNKMNVWFEWTDLEIKDCRLWRIMEAKLLNLEHILIECQRFTHYYFFPQKSQKLLIDIY